MAGFFAIYAVGIYFSNLITAAAVSVATLVSAATVRIVTGGHSTGFLRGLGLTVLGGLIRVGQPSAGGHT